MTLRALCLLCFFMLPLAALAEEAEQPISHEEHILMSHLLSLQSGLAYDEYCAQNDPNERLNFEKPENATLYGNLEMITSRLHKATGGGEEELEKPKVIIEKYLGQTKPVKDKVLEGLETFKCDNQNGFNAEAAFKYYFNTHPSQIYIAIDEQIAAKNKENQQEAAQ